MTSTIAHTDHASRSTALVFGMTARKYIKPTLFLGAAITTAYLFYVFRYPSLLTSYFILLTIASPEQRQFEAGWYLG